MGCFSWFTSDTQRAILMHNPVRVFALLPNGDTLEEREYDGFGVFGGQDIYDLVADWNREWLSKHPEFYLRCDRRPAGLCGWYHLYADLSLSREEVTAKMREVISCWEWRWIGIAIACYDEDNFRLPYPIKLVSKRVPYEQAVPSRKDPNQGMGRKVRYWKDTVKGRSGEPYLWEGEFPYAQI